jgi:TRAP-type mannitol/chloroaromatic compound transport system substrate-binding protein
MTQLFTVKRAALAALIASALAASPSTLAVEIKFRTFSGSATMGPQAQAFADRLLEVSTAALGTNGAIRFTSIGTPAIPGGDVVAAVGSGHFHAAYNSGSELNRAWGFIYNSGPPFGPNFDEHVGFLYGKSVVANDGSTITGLELAQQLLARRNVIAFPIVGSSEQLSGYFKKPIGDVPGTKGIGLAGLCAESWKLRYLPPAENVLGLACDDLAARGVIPKKNLSFIGAVPGGGSLLDGLRTEAIQGFEFATPLDDLSQVFKPTESPATYGNRYVHLPGWQQQFLITWMIVNLDVWKSLTPGQQAIFKTVARDHVIASYAENMRQQGAALKKILTWNQAEPNRGQDLVLSIWPKQDQELLVAATIKYLDARAADASLGIDGQEYARILEAYRLYVRSSDSYWDDRGVNPKMRFDGWKSASGESWNDKPSR